MGKRQTSDPRNRSALPPRAPAKEHIAGTAKKWFATGCILHPVRERLDAGIPPM
jgi:hypothetical protein